MLSTLLSKLKVQKFFFFHKYVSESFSILLFLTLSDANRKQNSDRKQVAAKLSREIASKVNPAEKSQMESDGGIDTDELNTVLSKSNIKPSADITEKFNELDTNKNGKLEESEVSSTSEEGEDYFLDFLGGLAIPDFCMKIKMGLMTSAIRDPRCDPLYMTPNCNYKNTEGC